MLSSKRKLTAVLVFLLISTCSKATLIIRDYQTVGDGLITYDSTTNLEWMDLTETRSLTYNDVMGQLNPNGLFSGWRYATSLEGKRLYSQFGLTLDRTNQNFAETKAGVDKLNHFLGDMMSEYNINNNDSFFGSLALTKTPYYFYRPSPEDWIVTFQTSYNPTTGFFIDETNATTVFCNAQRLKCDSFTGSLLVREVNAPNSLTLFILVMGIIILRVKVKRNIDR